MIKAVVFDFDGLILDTESQEFAAVCRLYQEHGTEMTIDIWGKCIGTDSSFFNVYDHLEQTTGRAIDRPALMKYRRSLYLELMEGAQLRAGVTDYLETAKSLGLRIGLASSSNREWVTGYLEQYGIRHYFETVRTKEDVPAVKPQPFLYQLALEDLGVKPEEAIAFEDSPNGALAAVRAGMRCVIVPNEVTSVLPFGDHDLRLSSMADMPLADVIAAVKK
jgi:HAD superfamily hydrolase (TIGR01509 family)